MVTKFAMENWRLLDTPAMTAAENMAMDETLLEIKSKGKSFYKTI